MKSVKINNPSEVTKAIFWVKENGSNFWRPVTIEGVTTADSKFSDNDILNGLFSGAFTIHDEKLNFEFIKFRKQ